MPNNNPVFIIAEAASNWRTGTRSRDLQMARSLIDIASESGANAIKFQTYKAKSVYAPGAGSARYLEKSGLRDSMEDLFTDLAMPYELIVELADYCKVRKIEFMSTPFSVSDAEVINPFVRIHKIASYEISHIRLIEYVAHTGKPLILSTGACDYEDIEWAMNCFYDSGWQRHILTTSYSEIPGRNWNAKFKSDT